MNDRALATPRHAAPKHRTGGVEAIPSDPRNPGDVFLRREIDRNRKAERWLILKAGIALMLVAGLIVIRQVFFT